MSPATDTRPLVILDDGNAWSILGACRRAALSAGWSREQFRRWADQACSHNYGHLIQMVMKDFRVDLIREEEAA